MKQVKQTLVEPEKDLITKSFSDQYWMIMFLRVLHQIRVTTGTLVKSPKCSSFSKSSVMIL